MVDFSSLRKNSGAASLQKLTQELEKMNTSSSTTDDRMWYPNVDAAGNGYAVIRFLPAPGDEESPFVRKWSHGFKGPTGQWYIENSLSTLGKEDPVGVMNSKLWNMSDDDNSPSRKQARAQKRKLSFISNIYIVEDKLNPEHNGKVMLFSFGKRIFDKLNEAMNPSFPDQEPMNPFDLWTGANLKIKIRKVESQRNYDMSSFDTPGPLFKDDSLMENIWKQEHSLQALIAPSNFKSYEELQARLNKVLGINENGTAVPAAARAKAAESEVELPRSEPKSEPKAASRPAPAAEPEGDDDDDLQFFKNLTNK